MPVRAIRCSGLRPRIGDEAEALIERQGARMIERARRSQAAAEIGRAQAIHHRRGRGKKYPKRFADRIRHQSKIGELPGGWHRSMASSSAMPAGLPSEIEDAKARCPDAVMIARELASSVQLAPVDPVIFVADRVVEIAIEMHRRVFR